MLKFTCVALLLLVPSVASAQKNQPPPPPSSTITLSIPGLNCSTAAGGGTFKVSSWSWGATNAGTTVGGAGETNLQDLSVSKSFDACSAALLTAVTSGATLKGAVLTQVGSDATKVTIVRLEVVKASSWQLGSTTTDEVPAENLTLNFTKVCIDDQASGSSGCYDASTATP